MVGISALKGTGIRKVAEKAVAAARAKKAFQQVHSFCEAVEEVITRVEELIPETEEAQKRFLAIRLLEKDEKMDELMKDPPDVSGLSEQLETEFDAQAPPVAGHPGASAAHGADACGGRGEQARHRRRPPDQCIQGHKGR